MGYSWAFRKEACNWWRWSGETLKFCLYWWFPREVVLCSVFLVVNHNFSLLPTVYRKEGCLCLEWRSWGNSLHRGTTRRKGSWKNFWCLFSAVKGVCRQLFLLLFLLSILSNKQQKRIVYCTYLYKHMYKWMYSTRLTLGQSDRALTKVLCLHKESTLGKRITCYLP